MATNTLTITLDGPLASRLSDAATAAGTTAYDLVVACVEQHLEVALRHKVLIDRMDTVDAQIDAIAQFIEEASSGGGLSPVDLFRICRYPSKKKA